MYTLSMNSHEGLSRSYLPCRKKNVGTFLEHSLAHCFHEVGTRNDFSRCVLFRIPQEGEVNEDIHRLYRFSGNKGGSGICFLLLITLWESPRSTVYIHT